MNCANNLSGEISKRLNEIGFDHRNESLLDYWFAHPDMVLTVLKKSHYTGTKMYACQPLNAVGSYLKLHYQLDGFNSKA